MGSQELTREPGARFPFMAEAGLLALSVLLFFLSFPNPIFHDGLGFLGFVAFFPIFWLIPRLTWFKTLVYGAVFGFLCYGFFNFWLGTFHPLALLIVPLIYLLWHLLLFPLLKLAFVLFPRHPYWVLALIWTGYEFTRTQGFLGYSYGVLGYSQWQFLPFIQSASLFGVWGLVLLVIFPSAWLASLARGARTELPTRWRSHFPSLVLYLALFVANLVFGFLVLAGENRDRPVWKPALIQHDLDPWRGGYEAYAAGLERLIDLSRGAVAQNPDAVIWSETAFVPSIFYHEKYRENAEAYRLVRRLRDFLSEQNLPFVLGNDHGEKRIVEGVSARVDFNAALMFKDGDFQAIYKKIHLVPFTESFPYKDLFPWAYKALKEADTHFWEKGEEFTIFDLGKVKVATPICFEDTFGDLSREFIRRGADVLVNLTNDSWSGSEVAMTQHFAIAVFRAVENHRSLVRAANGGLTAAVDPYGRVLSRIPVFSRQILVAEVPIVREPFTLYTAWGDWAGWGSVLVVLVALVSRTLFLLLKKRTSRS